MNERPEKKKARRTRCYCGSSKFTTSITLRISNVPVWIGKGGRLHYDDTKGHSEGWDTNEQPAVACAKCGHLFDIERIGDPMDTVYLVDKVTGDGRSVHRP